MVYQIAGEIDEPRRLTQAVLQITDMLDLYQAELARILHAQCGDIGRLAAVQQSLEPALLLVRCYRALYILHDGNGVAMRHWPRIPNEQLGGIPHLLLVDDGRLADVVVYLEDEENGLF